MINLYSRLKELESSYDFYYYLSSKPSRECDEVFKSLRNSLPESDDDTDIFDHKNYLIISWAVEKKEGGSCWNQNKHYVQRTNNVIPPLYLVFKELKGSEIASIVDDGNVFCHTIYEYYGNETEYRSMTIPVIVIDRIYAYSLNEVINWNAFL